MTLPAQAQWKRISQSLAEHAVAIMPTARKEWARAMRAELASLDAGIERLQWSLGCLRAAYSERARDLAALDRLAVRVLIALVSLSEAHVLILSAMLAWAARAHPDWAARYLPSDSLQVYAAVPPILVGLSALSAVLYAVAAVCLVRHRRSAVPYFMTAVATELLSRVGFSCVSLSVDSWSAQREALHYGVWVGYTMLALMVQHHFRNGELPRSRGPS